MVIEQDGIGGWVTTAEAARLAGIQHNSVFRRIELGKLPAIKVGHTLLVRIADLPQSKFRYPEFVQREQVGVKKETVIG